MLEALKKIKIDEIAGEISILESMPHPCKKYNWLQRKIIKKNEYLEYKKTYEQKMQQLEELKYKKEKIKGSKTIQALGLNITQAIQLLEEKGLPVVMNENDFTDILRAVNSPDKKPDVDELEGLILIHKTNHPPIDSRIQSVKEKGIYVDQTHTIAGEQINTRVRRSRNTVHFAVNGEVASHLEGNWDEKKYAVLIPFIDVPRETFGNTLPEDTYTRGGVKLTPNSWILVPKGEKDLVKRNNPNVNIIEYDGKNVTRFADTLVVMLGYRHCIVDNHGWTDAEDHNKFIDLMKVNGFNTKIHHNSTDKHNETFETYMQIIAQIIQYITQNVQLLENQKFVDELEQTLKMRFTLALSYLETEIVVKEIYDYLLSESFVIPEENMIKIYKYLKNTENQKKIAVPENVAYIFTHEIINILKKDYKDLSQGKTK